MTGKDLVDLMEAAEAQSGMQTASHSTALRASIERYLELTAPLEDADPMQMSAQELELLELRNELLGRA